MVQSVSGGCKLDPKFVVQSNTPLDLPTVVKPDERVVPNFENPKLDANSTNQIPIQIYWCDNDSGVRGGSVLTVDLDLE